MPVLVAGRRTHTESSLPLPYGDKMAMGEGGVIYVLHAISEARDREDGQPQGCVNEHGVQSKCSACLTDFLHGFPGSGISSLPKRTSLKRKSLSE
ncbi:hypothetical protein BaRGS_00002577 [Batillaria attramentaria]|uniref:Uncharacterized protein n=1 Tax=Batillaria attramentaria TaxID=370345 RepID=A0ABD0M3I8_9CAEN